MTRLNIIITINNQLIMGILFGKLQRAIRGY
jgi:hypothetical protein